MAPAISRSVTAASSVASSLPHSSSFSLKNNNKAFNLRNAFLPQIGTRSNSFSCSVLKWKLERRESRVVVRCEAATVAEKETPESSGEKYEYQAEGEVEFRSVLYIPGMAPLNNEDVVNPKTKNIHLYVKRVFISDDFDGELFPRYLSFVKGVVDSNDLPFNVSREILQESRIVRIMRKRLVGKAFDMIQDLAESENKEKRSEQMKAIWASTNKRPHNRGARPFAARVEEYKKKSEQAPHAKTYIDMYKKFDLKGMSWVQQASDEVVASLMVSMPPIEDTSDGSSSASVIAPLRLPVDVEIRVMEKVVGPSRETRVLGLSSGVAKQPKRRGSSQGEPKNAAVEEKLTRLRAYQKELEVRFQQKERDRERERQDREKDSEREQQERKRDRERERQDREKDREREQEERERDRKRERQDREKDREREQEQRERDRERERQDREKDRERE